MGVERSELIRLLKGTPQGSILGQFLFSVFQNDLMFVMSNTCDK